MGKRHYDEIGTEQVPEATAEMMWRRVDGIVRHCCLYEQNIVRAIALSCYMQGLIDGEQVAEKVAELKVETVA